MFKRINIVLCLLLLFAFDTISSQDNFKIFIPKYIPSKTGFEVSIITSNKFPDANKLNVYFLPGQSLSISKIEIWFEGKKEELNITNEFISGYPELFKMISIDFSDSSIFREENFFQIVLFLKPGSINSKSLKFFGEYLSDDKVIAKLVNSELEIDFEKSTLYEIPLFYYEKSSITENAVSLGYNSYLNIAQLYTFEQTLEVEFWLKAKKINSDFFKVVDWETNRAEYSISINENQLLAINSKNDELLLSKPYFLSNNVWYHFHMSLNKITNEFRFFVNGTKLAQTFIRNYISTDNLLFHFQCLEPEGELMLEQFRLVAGNASNTDIVRNSSFRDYSDDSTRVVFQIDFSDTELNELRADKKISYELIKFKKSDAPLFARAPEINVKLTNNYYEIEWSGGNFSDAAFYILEKAVSDGDFFESGKAAAENEEAKIYSLICEHNYENEIIYFRVKQVNKDGSIVYSEVVKVGQGMVEDLILGQNYPNPFNPITTIEFDLLQDSDVEVTIYDLAGKEVEILHKGFLSSGLYKLKFDASGLTSGIYLYQVKTSNSSLTRKMILAK